MEYSYVRKVMAAGTLVILAILAFLVIKPILMDIILGFLLAFIFLPVYSFINKYLKIPSLSATIICVILFLIVLLPIWFFTPTVIDEAFKIYQSAQQTDFVSILKGIFPSLFASEQFSSEIGGMMQSFITKMANSLLNVLSEFILNFPTLMLHSLVVVFTFFFALKDKDKLTGYIKSLSPFTKDVEKKFFNSSKDITASVLYGQVILGIVQGVVVSLGFFLFGVPNAFVLGILAVVAGIIPIIGPMFIWVPVAIYFILQGSALSALGIFIFGIIGSNIDNILRPFFVAKRTKIHSSIVLIGMIGGLFLFGVLGLILGPLILAYLLIILEIYRDKSSKNESYTALIKSN